jgi:hypothetical protein
MSYYTWRVKIHHVLTECNYGEDNATTTRSRLSLQHSIISDTQADQVLHHSIKAVPAQCNGYRVTMTASFCPEIQDTTMDL